MGNWCSAYCFILLDTMLATTRRFVCLVAVGIRGSTAMGRQILLKEAEPVVVRNVFVFV